jgi:hypothetical protein
MELDVDKNRKGTKCNEMGGGGGAAFGLMRMED